MRLPFKLPRHIQVYRTSLGVQVVGDSRNVLTSLPKNSIDLIVTSPPFALLRQKSYGNKAQHEYVQWLMEFGKAALPKLKESGSFVLDLGGAYQRGKPVRSLYNFHVLTEFCDTLGYHLAEEFFWFNPAKLPSPIEWVNKRKIRTKDAVNTVWWFSKTEHPKADVTKVLVPYSKRMRALLEDPEKFYKPKERPSGHDIAKAFGKNNGGSIPPNLLNIPNTDSNSHYLRTCQVLGRKRHPARYPLAFPRFFLKFLTDPGDVVIDIFSGSNTTGQVADELDRRWLSIELDLSFAALSAVRFMAHEDIGTIATKISKMEDGKTLTLRPRWEPTEKSQENLIETQELSFR